VYATNVTSCFSVVELTSSTPSLIKTGRASRSQLIQRYEEETTIMYMPIACHITYHSSHQRIIASSNNKHNRFSSRAFSSRSLSLFSSLSLSLSSLLVVLSYLVVVVLCRYVLCRYVFCCLLLCYVVFLVVVLCRCLMSLCCLIRVDIFGWFKIILMFNI
jgi:hypothetical protein